MGQSKNMRPVSTIVATGSLTMIEISSRVVRLADGTIPESELCA